MLDFEVLECSIPPALTLAEYRAARPATTRRRSILARLLNRKAR